MRGLTQESGISGLGRFNAIILDFWYQQQEHRRRGAWSHSEAYRTCESPQIADRAMQGKGGDETVISVN